MVTTFTISATETYSEADVKAVMRSAYEDIIGFANRGMVTFSSAKSWIEDLIYILNKKALKFFEIQLYDSNNRWLKTYKYEVSSGYLTNSASGGINYYEFPSGSYAKLFASLDFSKQNAEEVNRILHEERGWGYGSQSQGSVTQEKTYVSGNLSLNRSVIQ